MAAIQGRGGRGPPGGGRGVRSHFCTEISLDMLLEYILLTNIFMSSSSFTGFDGCHSSTWWR